MCVRVCERERETVETRHDNIHNNETKMCVRVNDVGRISLDRGSARGPGGPIPRSSIQERNEREAKGITISDRATMITPTKGHRHATQINLLQTPHKDASGMARIIHVCVCVCVSHTISKRKLSLGPSVLRPVFATTEACFDDDDRCSRPRSRNGQ